MIVDDKWLKAHADEIRKVDWIDPALYQKYNVKRGLRNGDGTGVLVGLTTIGNVHGYVVSEGEKQAIPGELYYRGINVRDIVREIVAERFPDFKIKELDAVVHCVRRKPKTEGAKK